jgi:hypothetical protein
MTEDERNAELLRLNEEGRQNVFRLHRGEISEEVFVARMKALQAEVQHLVHPEQRSEAGNGKEG